MYRCGAAAVAVAIVVATAAAVPAVAALGRGVAERVEGAAER